MDFKAAATAKSCRKVKVSHGAVKLFDRCGLSCKNARISSVFRRRRKMSSDSEDCTAVGKLFHTRAPVELNAWPPMVMCLVRETSSMADDDERRRCWKPTLLACWSWAVR